MLAEIDTRDAGDGGYRKKQRRQAWIAPGEEHRLGEEIRRVGRGEAGIRIVRPGSIEERFEYLRTALVRDDHQDYGDNREGSTPRSSSPDEPDHDRQQDRDEIAQRREHVHRKIENTASSAFNQLLNPSIPRHQDVHAGSPPVEFVSIPQGG